MSSTVSYRDRPRRSSGREKPSDAIITGYDLHEAARGNGIINVQEIELAMLDPDGSISFSTRPSKSD